MTPEEQRLLGDLAQRVRSVPPQQKDPEAEEFLRRLVQERPETVYILAQTVIMQEFALKNAEAQMQDLQRQVSEASAPRQSGGFLGGLFGGGAQPQPQPSRNPWGAPQQQGYGQQPPYQGGPAMQPQQQGGFLRNAATTAVGVAGGALLFSGISSMFGHDSAVTQAAAAANPEAAAGAGESFPQSDYADNSGGGDDSWGFGDDGGDFA
ncbi:putative periplasmic ligand-binding sensor protein [Rhodomicrobium vannielii ATCC 17100]|uniref:Putative periplasmic ligand-binding sensor protein n=1 Tax=Rhodomicrobium vannielii (strain ATCC 17100 / DSM 162 / LMG 4299 / NCIMB 10020 / ATH 3.1.1) TaxID=648757 RepID=E3I0D2_RHOVT|nr:DUF2076 domain-containing protein [Rhodomicrobium vannielii]ADP72250.1 putative periplasmic ligand-binding sensor protein [Rhodomicrobium vannielii ATCC 17100]